jgi:hypothetical protein
MFFLALVFMLPLASSPPLQAHIVDLPGAKLLNFIAGAFALGFLSGISRVFQIRGRLGRTAIVVFFVYISVFLVAFLRSVPNLGRFHGMAQDVFPAGVTEYVLSYLLVPLVIASTFPFVLTQVTTPASVTRFLRTVGLSIFVLSGVVVAAVASRPEVYADPERFAMAKLMSDFLGMHYNAVGTIYIIAGPILVYLALTREAFWTANYFLALFAVMLLESRAALFLFVGMSGVTMVSMGRARALVALIPPLIVVALIAVGPLLVQLLTIGVTEHSGISMYALLSGRDERIWLPLIAEWWSDPQRFWFGAGEFGILTSFMLFSGRILAVGHSHNAFLNFFLDNGIILEVAMLAGVCALLAWSWRTARRIHSQLFWVLFFSMVGFLIAGMMGRILYPEQENALLLPILALMVNIARKAAPAQSRVPGAHAGFGILRARAAATKT